MTERSPEQEEAEGDSLLMVLLVSLTGLVASLQAAFHAHAPVSLALFLLS